MKRKWFALLPALLLLLPGCGSEPADEHTPSVPEPSAEAQDEIPEETDILEALPAGISRQKKIPAKSSTIPLPHVIWRVVNA